MQLSVSNIAWETDKDAEVATLLQRLQIGIVDIAPTKYFPDLAAATASSVAEVRLWWADQGVQFLGAQSLLFGTQGLNLFADAPVQKQMLDHLDRMAFVCSMFGASKLVFGSPRNRDRAGIKEDEQALAVAVDFFLKLGTIGKNHGVQFCLEPNPKAYGANFMTTTSEALQVVKACDHPAIRLQLDTGTIAMNDELLCEEDWDQLTPWVGHIHASDRNLGVLGHSGYDHQPLVQQIRQKLGQHTVALEMLTKNEEAPLVALETGLKAMKGLYEA